MPCKSSINKINNMNERVFILIDDILIKLF